MKNKKGQVAIKAAIVVIIIITAAVFIGLFLKQNQALQANKTTIIKQPVIQTPIAIHPVEDTLNAKINILEQKWENGGLVNWQKEDFINSSMSILAPKNTLNSFSLSSDPRAIKDYYTNSQFDGSTLGVLTVGKSEVGKIWGSCLVSQSTLPQGIALEKWIQDTWKNIITLGDCNGKNNPLSEKTLRGETWGEFCKMGAKIDNKVSDTIIRWNTSYIGSAPIISAVVGNKIISFECGQDISEATSGKMDFVNLVEDLASTIQSENINAQNYTNTKYGFQVALPVGWEAKDIAPGDIGGEAIVISPINKTNETQTLGFSVGIFKSKDTPKKWYADNYEDVETLIRDGDYKGQIKDLKINNLTAFYVNEVKDSYTNPSYVISNGNIVLFFSFREKTKGDKYSYEKYLPDFENVVNSIKFN